MYVHRTVTIMVPTRISQGPGGLRRINGTRAISEFQGRYPRIRFTDACIDSDDDRRKLGARRIDQRDAGDRYLDEAHHYTLIMQSPTDNC